MYSSIKYCEQASDCKYLPQGKCYKFHFYNEYAPILNTLKDDTKTQGALLKKQTASRISTCRYGDYCRKHFYGCYDIDVYGCPYIHPCEIEWGERLTNEQRRFLLSTYGDRISKKKKNKHSTKDDDVVPLLQHHYKNALLEHELEKQKRECDLKIDDLRRTLMETKQTYFQKNTEENIIPPVCPVKLDN